MRSSPSIGIGISTKNRWKDLAVTLEHLRDDGLDCLETIVIDDGSDTPAPDEMLKRFQWVKFVRFEQSQGYITQRNRLGRLLSTEFYLSLDDDSFPVRGDLGAASAWLHDHPEVAALALRIIFAEEPLPADSDKAEPVLVKDFIGCGFILRREMFLSLGGFEERLYFYHEEPEYCFRTFQLGYQTYLYPSIVIRHMVTSISRNFGTRTRYFIRNVVLMDLWYYPGPRAFLRAVAHLPLLYKHVPNLRRHPITLLRGWLEGFFRYVTWRKLKRPLTGKQLAVWNSLPGCHQAMGSKTSA